MITKVLIENYQSHKHTEIEFVPGTNVIIGESDAGKSGIFRAIYWVTNNRPLGDSFRSEWGGDTRVTVGTDDGHVIERLKTASRNEYIVDGEVLTAFGTEVPQKVSDILQLDAFNIQAQWDVPFLLFNTPGEAARMLNKAASLDDIDRAIAGLKGSVTRTGADIIRKEEDLKQNETALAKYNNLEEVEELVVQVERRHAERNATFNRSIQLQRLVEGLEEAQEDFDQLADVPDLLEKVETVENWLTGLRRIINKRERVSLLVTRIEKVTEGLKYTEHIEEALDLLDKATQAKGICEELTAQRYQLSTIFGNLSKTQALLDKVNRAITQLQEEYDRIAPDTCPLCGAGMKKEGQ